MVSFVGGFGLGVGKVPYRGPQSVQDVHERRLLVLAHGVSSRPSRVSGIFSHLRRVAET